jgi:hypothetical protein
MIQPGAADLREAEELRCTLVERYTATVVQISGRDHYPALKEQCKQKAPYRRGVLRKVHGHDMERHSLLAHLNTTVVEVLLSDSLLSVWNEGCVLARANFSNSQCATLVHCNSK